MFADLIEWFKGVWDDFKPIYFIKEYELGVRLRGGKWKHNLLPGMHLRWPFYDDILTHYAKDDTILLPSQKVTTKDGKSITARGIILYYIDDIKLFLTEVNHAQQAIADMAMGMIATNIVAGDYEDCYNDKIMNEITKDVRREAKKWGAYITYFKLTDISISRTISLTKESEAHL